MHSMHMCVVLWQVICVQRVDQGDCGGEGPRTIIILDLAIAKRRVALVGRPQPRVPKVGVEHPDLLANAQIILDRIARAGPRCVHIC